MDNAVYPYRLVECGLHIVDDLHHAGQADKCGGCGKPFHAARKWQSVARTTICDETGETYTWSWLLCRKCTREAKRNGGYTPEHLKRQAYEEALLLMATPGGAA